MFRKIIENRKPKYAERFGYVWPLWATRWFGIGLVLRIRSDTSFDQRAEANRIRIVLEGEYMEHREVPRTGEFEPAARVPKDAYTYGNQYGLWACSSRKRGAVSFEPVGRRGGVELFTARDQGDSLIDFPNWMQHRDVVFDADRPVLMLTITWGGCWS